MGLHHSYRPTRRNVCSGGDLMNQVLIAIIAVIVAPFIGGLLAGIDRKVTARLQGRYGPRFCSRSMIFSNCWVKLR